MREFGLDSNDLGWGSISNFCECDKEPLWNFLLKAFHEVIQNEACSCEDNYVIDGALLSNHLFFFEFRYEYRRVLF